MTQPARKPARRRSMRLGSSSASATSAALTMRIGPASSNVALRRAGRGTGGRRAHRTPRGRACGGRGLGLLALEALKLVLGAAGAPAPAPAAEPGAEPAEDEAEDEGGEDGAVERQLEAPGQRIEAEGDGGAVGDREEDEDEGDEGAEDPADQLHGLTWRAAAGEARRRPASTSCR